MNIKSYQNPTMYCRYNDMAGAKHCIGFDVAIDADPCVQTSNRLPFSHPQKPLKIRPTDTVANPMAL